MAKGKPACPVALFTTETLIWLGLDGLWLTTLVAILFARGTTEQGNVGTLAGPPFFQAVASRIGASKVAVQGVRANLAALIGLHETDGTRSTTAQPSTVSSPAAILLGRRHWPLSSARLRLAVRIPS